MAGLSRTQCDALAMIAGVLRSATASWWIIAGAAVALHARAVVAVDDIDVLIGEQDVALVRALAGVSVRPPDGNALFRSAFYAASDAHGVRIEWMAGFELWHVGGWQPIRPRTRVMIDAGDGLMVPVPDRAEMVAMLTRFGRDKDVTRIALLDG